LKTKKIAKRRIISAPPKAFLISNTTIGLWKQKAVHSFVGSGKGRKEGGREEDGWAFRAFLLPT
jgi:hypothetical protein